MKSRILRKINKEIDRLAMKGIIKDFKNTELKLIITGIKALIKIAIKNNAKK